VKKLLRTLTPMVDTKSFLSASAIKGKSYDKVWPVDRKSFLYRFRFRHSFTTLPPVKVLQVIEFTFLFSLIHLSLDSPYHLQVSLIRSWFFPYCSVSFIRGVFLFDSLWFLILLFPVKWRSYRFRSKQRDEKRKSGVRSEVNGNKYVTLL